MSNENQFPEYDKYLDGDEEVIVKRSALHKEIEKKPNVNKTPDGFEDIFSNSVAKPTDFEDISSNSEPAKEAEPIGFTKKVELPETPKAPENPKPQKPMEDISSKSSKAPNKLKIGLGILCGVTGALEVIAMIMLAMIGVLPTSLLILAGVAFALLLFIICTLMFMKSKHKFGKRKIVATILAAITIISCAIGIFFMGKIIGVFGAITKDGKKISKDDLDNPFVLYISGSDTRNTTLSLESRSDTNILAIVNPQTNKVLLLNTPRDSYVENPHLDNAKDKLTHCGIYGIDNSMAALENLYGVEIDYYCKINFTGVITLIDAIGGVDIYSDVAFTTEATSNVHINAGNNHLNGEQALAFARERYALAGGDFSRGENQMKLIKAVADKLMDSSTLLKSAPSVMKSLEGMFTTDCPQLLITSLIKGQLTEGAQRFDITSFAVTGSTGMATCASDRSQPLSVVYLDDSSVEEAKAMIADYLVATKAE